MLKAKTKGNGADRILIEVPGLQDTTKVKELLGATAKLEFRLVGDPGDPPSEFEQLRYVNLFTGDKTVISGRLSWDIEELAISRDGHYLAYVSNEAGIDKLNVLDLRTHQDLIPPKLPAAGIVGSLNFDAEGNDTGPGWGWAAMLLPQFEQATIFNALNFSRSPPAIRTLP